MSKTIFVSNRLPVTVKKEDDKLSFHKSIGGLATGLQGYHEKSDSLWVGWTGLQDEIMTELDHQEIESILLKDYKCVPVNLTEVEIDRYYYGFSNKTIWPLFHYFSNLASHDVENWDAYKKVNLKFYNSIKNLIEEDDIIWIHDYQLMLLPQMIRENHPKVKIGFFLHIPFPSYEIFRTIVWREELLEGVLGSDLIGFHTYDYVRHFLSSVRRILGCEHHLNTITFNGRYVKADVFPMGIDFNHFAAEYKDEGYKSQFKAIKNSLKDIKMILSIDRLDYTKGIPERIKAYRRFLELYPEFIGKVRLNLIVAPSREAVDSYKELLKEIQILVSEVNGELGTISWQPIFFFFQSFTQEELIAYYRSAEVMLVTPLRDGMNLVVKEYLASRTDYAGMVVISETAGAASELGEYIIVNPNDLDQIAEGIKQALEMPIIEKQVINQTMCKRLKRYNVKFWAEDFMYNLTNLITDPMQLTGQVDLDEEPSSLLKSFEVGKNRLLLLDYDGTLVGFKSVPEKARPDRELKELLQKLVDNKHNTVVIVSGRDHVTLEKWFGDLKVHLIASHGLWLKHPDSSWEMTISLNNEWKSTINHVLEVYADRMPGALIEEKDYSLAFHYRLCEPDLVATKLHEVKDALVSMTQTMTIGLQEGNKVIEMKDLRVNKGYGASEFLKNPNYDFIMSIGDDVTDEDLFDVLGEDSFGIKVGLGNSKANYRVRSWQSVRKLLNKLSSY
ncbi:bifunctional alpha,alpha-trehalose-phosphate synthase (UDP-forming)/trehalose-phosphatase [Fusibacter bizertensis]|uniref:Bifunctional alpha,alpha-trehalose-phosphate synthase (UDP-forming)/trehalose-phosphatase n=1 Tax=Fusibacter bizertensis TaxID=1488331 RepID=A0ABT6NCT2_9FIRM|nr:bifunctional alpha,alpha-trehalose-phosphate synthase (UDP-forming)/trehalose-phosphatase [Fusibacter bizertensis]MDH8678224.1 bifunctional alpha,alpha-trehalose-phosphate synthase (UDP-forming)/trehalose-phosphatase [Fusibacter bizertensis]